MSDWGDDPDFDAGPLIAFGGGSEKEKRKRVAKLFAWGYSTLEVALMTSISPSKIRQWHDEDKKNKKQKRGFW